MHLEDVKEGDTVIANFTYDVPINSLEGKVVDVWVTDLPYEVKIGVEFPTIILDRNFENKGHSCRRNGKDGFCHYLNLNEIELKDNQCGTETE